VIVEKPVEVKSFIHHESSRTTDLAAIFRANILAERRKRGWFQSQLAKKMKTTRSWISKTENGHCAPELRSIQNFADAFEIPAYLLLVPRVKEEEKR